MGAAARQSSECTSDLLRSSDDARRQRKRARLCHPPEAGPSQPAPGREASYSSCGSATSTATHHPKEGGGYSCHPDSEAVHEQHIADAFLAGTGGRKRARPHQVKSVSAVMKAVVSDCDASPGEATNYLLQHRLWAPPLYCGLLPGSSLLLLPSDSIHSRSTGCLPPARNAVHPAFLPMHAPPSCVTRARPLTHPCPPPLSSSDGQTPRAC